MIRTVLLQSVAIAMTGLVLVGCSDSKARRRVAAMDTETLERLSTEYPADSKSGRLIAAELSRRPRKPASPAARSVRPSPTPPKPTVSLPKYQIVDRDKYDAPVKTQIELHAVVSGNITESGLKALLQKLYEEATATRGFKYHGGKPTHIFIYLYTSRDHFTSGMGQWIAMLSKVGADSRVDTRVKTELIAQLTAKPEQKHGLSEPKRKEIFRASVTAEDRAAADAERLHPIPDPSKPGYSQSQASAQVMKQAEALTELTKKYNSQVARRYGISDDQLTAIAVEGIKKNWPMP